MRLLLTRPQADSQAFAELLAEKGHDCRIEALLEIHYSESAPINLEPIQAVLITSANGVDALVRRNKARDCRLFTVGDGSARRARCHGYSEVESANGDVDDLAALVKASLDPAAGPLLQIAGTRIAGDLSGILRDAGFAIERRTLYEARTPEDLSTGCIEAIRRQRLDGAVFFSPRTAGTFVNLAGRAGLAGELGQIAAYCLSDRVAEQCRALTWASIVVAAAPTQAALMARIEEAGR